MKALGPSRSYSRQPVIASPKSIRPDKHHPSFSRLNLRNVFSGQDDCRCVQWNERCRIAKKIVEPVQIFLRQPETLMPGATSLDLSMQEAVPARLDAGQLSNRNTLHLGNGLANLSKHALFLILRQSGPRLRAQGAVQPRDN